MSNGDAASGLNQQEWGARYDRTIMNTFGHPKRVLVRGEGAVVWDADGKRYTDFLAGIAVNALGHANPEVNRAVAEQMNTLGHISNSFASPTQIRLGEELVALASRESAPGTPARVFFANSGTEANEAAFKATRMTGRKKIVAMIGSFHGRSMGSLAITYNEHYRKPFEPLPGEIIWTPYGDVAALEKVVDDTVAAVVTEPIQGENGVIEPPDDFLPAVRRITAEHGALMWIDEVQTGMGRCGEWFAHQRLDVVPDLISVAKGLGNGFPMGACIALGPAADLFGPGEHGTTFGGNPVACAAGLAVISYIKSHDLLDHVKQMGLRLADKVMSLDDPRIATVRGRGLLRGIVLTKPLGAEAAAAALEAGWIINSPRPSVLRIAPPLIVTAEQIDEFVDVLPSLLDAAENR
ncbi:Acetylornithine transaminase [Propionibacterium freudenreichii]|uniref:acetylornithine transaminase n=1 Tax=Propionibacterium freudenreichii TaxID=1744 RepID=UPI000BC2F598|nr:acetylornithine transaminase [Propionibacterium freudenreichii]MDK9662177.1 acetylornithine transaminase [Propionibacterium freudenreichii]SBN59820.1 Acetylornithine transaminase [Propionibacterium freudenreichii]SBT29049.1 Acetylornithine transaminase [Propionibacterium freudenreichii]SCQ48260.1 Acetylornithine transaminase [Propionibacterium freudenreichii]SCQ52780.1 Acetylornithine transaminase [Propionibacterium freudenreichii]